jgi:hypothetical protein
VFGWVVHLLVLPHGKDRHRPETRHTRFAGEHPTGSWSRGRAAKPPLAGYAPAKYQTKQWPLKALVEEWYSPEEVLQSFALAVSSCRTLFNGSPLCLEESDPRTRLPRPAAAETAIDPPDTEVEKVGYRERYALDIGFRRRTPTPSA